MEIKKVVGERLKESREEAGYTQNKIAALLNMTQQQYSRFERGIFELNYAQLQLLCKTFKVSADYLLGLSDEY